MAKIIEQIKNLITTKTKTTTTTRSPAKETPNFKETIKDEEETHQRKISLKKLIFPGFSSHQTSNQNQNQNHNQTQLEIQSEIQSNQVEIIQDENKKLNQSNSFSLKSFRNVSNSRFDSSSTLNLSKLKKLTKTNSTCSHQSFKPSSCLSLPNLVQPPTTPNSDRPPSITTISRPSSPSAKISAAAFREARAARNSRSLSYNSSSPSSIPIPTQTHSNIIHQPIYDPTRPSSSILSNSNPSHQRHSHQKSIASVQLKPTPISNTNQFKHNETLVPPRPAFYGSRPTSQSSIPDSRASLYYPPQLVHNHNLINRRPSTVVNPSGLYIRPSFNHSSTSIRSVPSNFNQPFNHSTSLPPRRRSTHTTRFKINSDQRQLEQWHSDEEDNPPQPNKLAHQSPRPGSISSLSNNNKSKLTHLSRLSLDDVDETTIKISPNQNNKIDDEDDEEDEVPLSKLKKKSFISLRGTAGAQTLARERQQLCDTNVKPVPFGFSQSPSPLGGSHTRPDSIQSNHSRHVSSSFLPNRQDFSIINHPRNSRSMSGPDIFLSRTESRLPIKTLLQPRGNSPASSSSGSGSGTWSIPITPSNQTGNPNPFLQIPPSSLGYQPHQLVSKLHQNNHQSRFTTYSPRSTTFDPSHSDMESIVSSVNPSKVHTPTSLQTPIISEAQKPRMHPTSGMWNNIASDEDLTVPPIGVDHSLYSTLSFQQKIELHRRSEMMKQMMNAQAKAAAQMHAMALSTETESRRQTIIDEGTGPILSYDPTAPVLYNWSPIETTSVNNN